MRIRTSAAVMAMTACLWAMGLALPGTAEETNDTPAPEGPPIEAPVADGAPRPSDPAPASPHAQPNEDAATESAPSTTRRKEKQCTPGVGCVTNLPLPRFVSLKGDEGNARRGPGLTHRIDWVFTRPGMPLKITAEFDNWRRVEDQDGAGGWVHYALLSGTRSVVVTLDMAELRDAPSSKGRVVAQAEMGVIGRILECQLEYCRIQSSGERGWIAKTAVWGVNPDEIIE